MSDELANLLQDVPDFRINRRKKHNLIDILVISVCAFVCGADDFEDIAFYGTQKEDFLRTFLELPNGISSHGTFNRVLKFYIKMLLVRVFIVGQKKF